MSTTSVGEGDRNNGIWEEKAVDPDLPIVDPHHHLWEFSNEFWQSIYPGRRGPPRFLLPDFLATVEHSGHNVTHTVAVECHAMYRAAGPEELRPVGETEFINGIAAMSASASYGPCRVAAAIVGSANLRLGDRVRPVLESQVAAGNGRLRGIRTWTAYTEDGLLGMPAHASMKGILLDDTFRQGVSALESLDLSLDIWCVHTQIPELTNLAAAFPRTTIILDHCGSPLRFGRFLNCEADVFATWRKAVLELAQCPNVLVKVGGLGVDLAVPLGTHVGHEPSVTVAEKWRPYVETCISAFGSKRCMFESNFPPDNATCTYGAVWNAFKRIISGCSEAEKTDLFSETAKKAYRLN